MSDSYDPDYIELGTEHIISYFKSPSKCNQNHNINFDNIDSSSYNYIGFINEKIPKGVPFCA